MQALPNSLGTRLVIVHVTHSGGRPVGTALEKLVKMCLTNTAGLIKSRVVYTHFDI